MAACPQGLLLEPKNHGFMYAHVFEDPDGPHILELMHMRQEAP